MDLRDLKKAKKREKLLMKQLQQERVNEKCSEWEELNMNQELHPISHYINDREEMIKQMFNVVSERQLMKMLPPGLKGISIEELQADCLIQLVGMSKKRITAILEGRELESSSESPSESDLDGTSMEEEPETIVNVSKTKKTKKASKRTATTALQDNHRPAVLNSKKLKTKHKVKKEKIEIIESEMSDDNDMDVDTAATTKEAGVLPEKENVEHKGKTLLEILELEMRAKAIRALLERENQPEEEKRSKNESDKMPESDKNEKVIMTTVERVVDNVKEGIADKNSDSNLILSATEKDSEDIVVLDEEIVKIDLTSDDDTPLKPEEASTKPTDVVTEKEPNLNSQSTAPEPNLNSQPSAASTSTPGTSTEISSESIPSTLDKSSKSPEKSNWAQRWLDSSKVKKVVTTSKMCTNIRRKIKKSLMMKTKQVEESQPVVEAEPVIPIQEFSGSTQEYELLKKLVKKKKDAELINQQKSESNTTNQGQSESNTQEASKSQMQESESNQQKDENFESQENKEPLLEEHSDLQENSPSQGKSETNLREESDSPTHDESESNLEEGSELQPQDNNDSNIRIAASVSEEIVGSNQEHVRTEPQEENESHLQEDRSQTPENIEQLIENIQTNPKDCSRSSNDENYESNTQEISETVALENSESIPDKCRESNFHDESSSYSEEDVETDRHEGRGTLHKTLIESPENNEFNAQEHVQSDSNAFENNSDNSSNKDTEPDSEDCEEDTKQ